MFLVTGATGNVGGEVVRALAGRGEPVRALTRDPATADFPDGAEAVAGDLNDPASLRPVLDGVRAVFLLPGYRDMPGQLAAFRDAGAERVVMLSGQSVAATDPDNAISKYMIDAEASVRASGLPWTFVRPSGFMSNVLDWAPQLRAGDVVRAPFADAAVAVIDPADIAAVAVAAMLSPDHAGQAYTLSGPEALRPVDRVRILGGALGRDLRLDAQSNEEARAEMSAAMPAEYVDAFFRFYVDGILDESRILPTVREVTGRAPRTFGQWAAAHADVFK